MMNEATLQFVRQHAEADVRQLALRGSKDPEVDMPMALQQIAGRQIAKKKLPSWAACEGVLYPPHLSMEQCSSEQTAKYKVSVLSGFIENKKDSTFVDLTGGFGVDFSFLAPCFRRAVYVERQEQLCQLARHNFDALRLPAEVVCEDAESYLHRLNHVNLIFLDPARRDCQGARTYGISDCTPDVLTLLDELVAKADYVLLKLSPMLDWRKTVSDLGDRFVREVHIVSVSNECKELLVLLSKHGEGLRVSCVNDADVLVFNPEKDFSIRTQVFPDSSLIPLSSYLYEPNASVMKAGCFDVLCQRYPVRQLAQSSHLFVADKLIEDFPGRKFRILSISSMNKRELKEKILPLKQANITVRNFPLSVAELRKRLKISEGGSHYIFATTLAQGEHVLLLCEQLF